MSISFAWFTTVLLCLGLAYADHVPRSGGGFPSLGFKMPSSVPSSLDGWWSDYKSEIGFLGFSYSVEGCQSANTLQSEFNEIRNKFNGRYVRLHGACDLNGFYDTIVDAAWNAGLGVHAMIWIDSLEDGKWQNRRNSLITSIQQNPKAKFVTRAVQFFAQPLTYRMLSAKDLAGQVKLAQKFLAPLGIPVTVSELAYGYQTNDDAQLVLDTIDFVDLAMLPYFNASATTAYKSWVFIQNDLTWITDRVKGKKIILSENSWPHEEPIAPPIPPATTNAVASWEQMEDYFSLLDFFCTVLKKNAGGGVAWFAHVYSTDQDAGYGILVDEVPHFPFSPLTSC